MPKRQSMAICCQYGKPRFGLGPANPERFVTTGQTCNNEGPWPPPCLTSRFRSWVPQLKSLPADDQATEMEDAIAVSLAAI